MKFSFLIPVYNCIQTLSGCVESLCAIGLTDWELLLIDDGSTDGSGALCDRLSRRFAPVRVFHQANGGVSAARNKGIREAQGRWIFFVDADDSLDPDALQNMLSDPESFSGDMLLFGMTFDYYRHGLCYRSDPLFYPQSGLLSRESWANDWENLFLCNSLSPAWNKGYRREMLLSHGLFFREDLFLYEDLEFVLRCMRYCDSVYNVPKAIYHYRQPEDEGGARRRVSRISSLSAWITPLEQAMDGLSDTVPASARQAVLLRLYLILAQEKISHGSLRELTQLSRDWNAWRAGKVLPAVDPALQKSLTESRTVRLYIKSRLTRLRHAIAVRVKSLRALKKEVRP